MEAALREALRWPDISPAVPYSGMPCSQPSRTRDLIELILGYGMIVGVLWLPERPQRLFAPIALLLTLGTVLVRRNSANELGVGRDGFRRSLWIFPAAMALAAVSIWAAAHFDTLHPLYKGDFQHISGYVLWTIYQQFLLQDYFMDRLLRLMSNPSAAVTLAGSLFAVAHLPNLVLATATLAWGIASCALFRRYRNLWMLGLAQGMLGLCFAICIPESLHHHLQVGLGYLSYHSGQPVP